MTDSPDHIPEGDAGAIDAAYKSFPGFESWLDQRLAHVEIWNQARSDLEVAKAAMSHDDLSRAVEVATRAAAVSTGAMQLPQSEAQ
jgi:hypothetical protein